MVRKSGDFRYDRTRHLSVDKALNVLDRVCSRASSAGRKRRTLNPLSREDQQLLFAVLRGEHGLRGFRSRDLVPYLNQMFYPCGSMQSSSVDLLSQKRNNIVPVPLRVETTLQGSASLKEPLLWPTDS